MMSVYPRYFLSYTMFVLYNRYAFQPLNCLFSNSHFCSIEATFFFSILPEIFMGNMEELVLEYLVSFTWIGEINQINALPMVQE